MQADAPEMLGPTLVAGVVFGALASLPYVKVLNACSGCSLVVLCGLVAAYLYSGACRRAAVAFRPANGAMVGLIAGALYGITSGVLEPLLTAIWGEPGLTALLHWIRESPSAAPATVESIDEALARMAGRELSPGSTLLSVFSSILVGAVFSTVGGLIGGALFRWPPDRAGTPAPPAGS